MKPFISVTQGGTTTTYTWNIHECYLLDDISDQSVSMLPFCQIKEKWYDYQWKDLPIIVLKYDDIQIVQTTEYIKTLPTDSSTPGWVTSDMNDEQFAWLVSSVIDEIRNGEWCNFVVSRMFQVSFKEFSHDQALSLYRQLIIAEPFAYMTFLFFDGEKYFLWASPETLINITDGVVTMNPISGTLHKKNLCDIDAFLANQKEVFELHKVVDEELKMMARICDQWWQIYGPYLKEMQSLIHTEYLLKWSLTVLPMEALRIALYAPTLTGWPIQNACRIIKKYEPTSRRYYGSALVIKQWEQLDSCITIRTAEISAKWVATLRAGATIVIDSDPYAEAAETYTKAQWLLNILSGKKALPYPSFDSEQYREQLDSRNVTLSQFLLNAQQPQQSWKWKHLYMIDNGDDFVYVIAHMLHSLHIQVTIHSSYAIDPFEYDGIIIGPWPWNPNEMWERTVCIKNRYQQKVPLLWVCLWHQLLTLALGWSVTKKTTTTQWIQQSIDLFGIIQYMGYYNSFWCGFDTKLSEGFVTIDWNDGYTDVLKWPWVHSVQFHPESVLSQYGYGYIQRMLESIGVL